MTDDPDHGGDSPSSSPPPPPPPPSGEERAIDLSEGRKGLYVVPSEGADPASLQGIVDLVPEQQAAPAEPPAPPPSQDE